MASFSAALGHVKEHLDQCLPKDFILDICRQIGHVWRTRKLPPDVTVHLFLLQILADVGLRGLRHVAGVNASGQAIGKAKGRLPHKLFARLLEKSLPKDFSMTAVFKGFKTYLVDGMSFMVEDVPKLATKYGKASNQRGTAKGYPTPKLLTLMEAGAAFVAKAIVLPYARQEYTCLSRLFKHLSPRSLLLGDRALVSFTHLVLLMAQGHHGCFRLARNKVVRGRGKGHRKLVKRLGRQDLLVSWEAWGRPTWISKRRWKSLADQTLQLRQISFRICRKGFRTNWAWIITTLTDPKLYPAQELIELYSQRWQIEVHFRDLKCTLKMRKISAKSIKGVRKEVMAFVLLYNLIRAVMAKAAANQGVSPDRISFTDAALWLLHAPPGSPLPMLLVNPRRSRATQPRRVKKTGHRFPPLKQPRAAACKPPCVVKI
jgi:Transposase DDE domain